MLLFPRVSCYDLEFFKQLRVGYLWRAGVFTIDPNRRRAAVGVTDAEVIEVDGVGARSATAEDDAMLAKRAGGVGTEADDAMLPSVRWIV